MVALAYQDRSIERMTGVVHDGRKRAYLKMVEVLKAPFCL